MLKCDVDVECFYISVFLNSSHLVLFLIQKAQPISGFQIVLLQGIEGPLLSQKSDWAGKMRRGA